MKKIVRTIACIGLTAALAQNAHAAEEWYVSNAGDDAADGKTPQTAWRTLEKVCAYGVSKTMRIRYGNGIELGGDAQNVVIERCAFKGVYDVAFTMQGFPKKGWKDVHVRNCTITDCTQAFEIWCKGAAKGVGFERCSFTGNRTLRVGGGWGELVRPMRACATPLLIYRMETDTVDIDVSGNTFENVSHGLLFRNGYDEEGPSMDRYPAGYRVHDNVVVTNRRQGAWYE